jgi:biphenyl 2,3-dioxygenase beta subunit
MRVKRLDTGLAHVETPPSVTRRLITNVRILEAQGEDVEVGSNFHVYQVHDIQESHFIGRRVDRLRGALSNWKIVRRTIYIAQPVLPRAVSIFF